MTTEAIRADAERRGITRLCHFTPLRNLVHIVTGSGLLSVAQLQATERACFEAQDIERLDGFPDHISCSIEYPNAWYLKKKQTPTRPRVRLFPTWVCLMIEPHHLWREETLYCERNAASGYGAYVGEDLAAYEEMFAARVVGAGGTYVRRGHQDACPTDAQAEVMIPRHIPLADVQAIAASDAGVAGDTYALLDQLGAPTEQLPILIAPDLFNPYRLASLIPKGQRPVETPWDASTYVADSDVPDA